MPLEIDHSAGYDGPSSTLTVASPSLSAGGYNPGNIKTRGGNYDSFATPQDAVSAIGNWFDRAQANHNLKTLRQLIDDKEHGYAPSADPGNAGKNLPEAAAKIIGVDPDKPIDVKDSAIKSKLLDAIMMQEQSKTVAQWLANPTPVGRTKGKYGAPNWIPSENAIASEQRKNDTDVVDMSPEQYLSLLPPIPDDASSKTKQDNLRNSLLAGDQIEQIPSLEVKPSRGNLKIVDHDGRNRAQAAIDAGLDTIPVSIRGVPASGDFKNLVGEKSVPYSDFGKTPPGIAQAVAPQATVVPPAQIGAGAPAPVSSPGPSPVAQPIQAAKAPIPQKPDYYPQIVGGVNKDILSPTSAPYRGVMPPNPTDNVTAGQRIANTNVHSAGQVGFGAQAPQNALGSLLSAINPIGSAQAAEMPQGSATVAIPPATVAPTGNLEIDTGETTPSSGDLEVESEPRQQKAPYIPGVSDIVPPIWNALSPIVTGPAAVAAGLRAAPQGINAWNEAAKNALAQTQLPETPVGQKISKFLGIPGQMFGWAAEKILGADKYNAIAPYASLASMAAAPLSLAVPESVGNVLADTAGLATRPFRRTPEYLAAKDINKAYGKEQRAGGKDVNTIRNDVQKAQAAGIPVVPADFALGGEDINKTLNFALASPEARAKARSFAEGRIKDTLPRLDNHIEQFFGTKNAFDEGKKVDKTIADTSSLLNKENELLSRADAGIASKTNELSGGSKTKSGFYTPPPVALYSKAEIAKKVAADPTITKLKAEKQRRESTIRGHNKTLDDASASKQGLEWGQSIYKPGVRVDNIKDFLAKSPNKQTAKDNLKTGIGYAMRNRVRDVAEGREVGAIDSTKNLEDKVRTVLSPTEADDFWNRIDAEGLVAAQSQNLLEELAGEPRQENRQAAMKRRAVESLGHFGFGLALGHGAYQGVYWGLRSLRNIGDVLSTGGVTPGRRRTATVNALLDPTAALATPGQRGLLQRPPITPSRLNTLSPTLPPAIYGASISPNQDTAQ